MTTKIASASIKAFKRDFFLDIFADCVEIFIESLGGLFDPSGISAIIILVFLFAKFCRSF